MSDTLTAIPEPSPPHQSSLCSNVLCGIWTSIWTLVVVTGIVVLLAIPVALVGGVCFVVSTLIAGVCMAWMGIKDPQWYYWWVPFGVLAVGVVLYCLRHVPVDFYAKTKRLIQQGTCAACGHIWNGCECRRDGYVDRSRCSQFKDGRCIQCGNPHQRCETNGHVIADCECTQCAKAVHTVVDCKCLECGVELHAWERIVHTSNHREVIIPRDGNPWEIGWDVSSECDTEVTYVCRQCKRESREEDGRDARAG